jgi:dihydrofolate reductase
VIGGAEIYRLALPLAERIYLTRVHAEVAGDARLPAIDWNAWERVSAETHGAEAPNPHDFSFEVYDRKLHD